MKSKISNRYNEESNDNLKNINQSAPFFNEPPKGREGDKWSWEKPFVADPHIQELEFNYVLK